MKSRAVGSSVTIGGDHSWLFEESVEVICSNCGYQNLPEMAFCGRCGSRLGTVCTACGFVNPPEHRFCGKCGSPLSADIAAREREASTVASVAAPPVLQALEGDSTGPVQLHGERRLATVVLADVVGSTGILEAVGTEAWVQLMNQVLQALEAQVYRYGGTVDQFRGDGLVAFFGASAIHEDDPERAVLAALAMHDAVAGFSAELRQRERMDLRLRVGVNTGELIVASIGDDRHYAEDTAMGEAITLAARMESVAEPGTVLVTEDTYLLVASRFDWETLGEVAAKGLREPVRVFRPLRPQTAAARIRHLEPYDHSALVIGREQQFDAAKKLLEKARAGQGGIVFLVGETGMGKSSFVENLHQDADREDALLEKAGALESVSGEGAPRSLSWLHARCRSYAQSSPYSIWQDLVGDWLNVRPDEPTPELDDRLCQQAGELWKEAEYDEYQEHCRNLSTLLSLSRETGPVDQLDAEGRRRRIFLSVRGWLAALARRGPLVLVLEDVHWSDTTSLELLEFCLPVSNHFPLLWLIVFRIDSNAALASFEHRVRSEHASCLTSLALTQLDDVQGAKMIDRLLGPDVLPEETRSLLLLRAEGNPYYIEEFIHKLIREGALARDEQTGRWYATRQVGSLDLPSSLQNLLLARIDRLAAEQRRVLQMAAVIGAVFWTNVLKALTVDHSVLGTPRLTQSELEWHLDALRRAQLIKEHRQIAALGVEYHFESNLIRDVVYEGLLSAQRALCHHHAADALETVLGEKVLPRYYSLLAFHYEQAGATRKELFYRLLAADEAREVYANTEALEHYSRALELLESIEAQSTSESQRYAIRTQRFEVLNGRRQVYFLTGDYAGGWRDAETLLGIAEQLQDDPVWLIDALLLQPSVRRASKDELGLGMDLVQKALALARETGDRRREMNALAALAGLRYLANDPAWLDTGSEAMSVAREVGDKRAEAELLIGVGGVFAWSDPERSREYLETALATLEGLDDKMLELSLLETTGVQLESSVDYVRRIDECHAELLRISRQVGHIPIQARSLMFLGQIQSLYLGDYEEGLVALEQSRELYAGQTMELFPILRIAQIRIQQGMLEEAQRSLDRAQQLAELAPHDVGRAGLRLVSAMFRNALGTQPQLLEALELLSQAFEMSSENPELSRQYQMAASCEATASHLMLADLQTEAEEREEHLKRALDTSQTAVTIFRSFGFVRPIECVSEEILLRHSLALQANGRRPEADAYLLQAYEEMMHKYNLIPADSPYRRTYLDNIPLHREISERVQGVHA